ncbi:rCG55620, isoform CRA_b, partial [Rattus norvegicus]
MGNLDHGTVWPRPCASVCAVPGVWSDPLAVSSACPPCLRRAGSKCLPSLLPRLEFEQWHEWRVQMDVLITARLPDLGTEASWFCHLWTLPVTACIPLFPGPHLL